MIQTTCCFCYKIQFYVIVNWLPPTNHLPSNSTNQLSNQISDYLACNVADFGHKFGNMHTGNTIHIYRFFVIIWFKELKSVVGRVS
jgi:hypothetical protein